MEIRETLFTEVTRVENRADRSRLSVVGADSFFEARDFVNFQKSGEGRESPCWVLIDCGATQENKKKQVASCLLHELSQFSWEIQMVQVEKVEHISAIFPSMKKSK